MCKKKYVYTEWRNDERGVTYISLLFGLLVISLFVPIIQILWTHFTVEPLKDDIKIQQFYILLRNEMLQAKSVTHDERVIYLQLETDELATISQYKDVIRRQVDGKGHEIYLRNVANFKLIPHNYGVNVQVESSEGNKYEKTIAFYE